MKIETQPKVCNICGGKVVYERNHKTNSGYCYFCKKCGAWVGTHKNDPKIALGPLADSETRKKRLELHRLLDRFWRSGATRTKLYEQLAKELEIDVENCHIAKLDIIMLEKAEKILIQWWRKKYDK